MRKTNLVLLVCMLAFIISGCSRHLVESEVSADASVSLNVTTTWSGTDGNSLTYQKWVEEYMKENNVEIKDSSGVADEAFKKRVILDFEVGGEADVLFYFNGSDADSFIEARKVVSLDTIREEYPDFASNLNDDVFVPSSVDGKVYSIPVYSYWEGLFFNKKVCEEAGVKVPDDQTTWREFLLICDKIKKAGYIPIAASLAKEPHYWFEFAIYNQIPWEERGIIPNTLDSELGRAWENGLDDLKGLYERGYFSPSTLYMSPDESFQDFLDGKAAFLVDGSWRIGTIVQKAENINDFGVTYVPGKGERKNTDIIGGFSSGWYISKKAWDDPDKRKAAVDFVAYMTRDEVVADFAATALSDTSLKKKINYEYEEFCELEKEAISMFENSTSMVTAVQDQLSVQSRAPLFEEVSDVVLGKVSAYDALTRFLESREDEFSK